MFVARHPKIGAASLAGIAMIFAGLMAILLGIFGIGVAGATAPDPHIITLCHRTDSYSNPYVTESVDVASQLFQGHDGHNGPVFFAAIPKDTKWGDIIPAFDFGPGLQYDGKNWTTEGQAIHANDCIAPDAIPTTTTSTTQPDDTTTTESTTTTSTVDVGGTTTTPSSGPVTIATQGTPDPSTPVTVAAVPGAGSGTLPFTGSPVVSLLGVGGALIASGIGLIARRRRWTD